LGISTAKVYRLFSWQCLPQPYLVSSQRTDQKETANVRINVTLRRVHATIFAVENHYVFHILSVCL